MQHHFGEQSLVLIPSGGMHLWVRLPDGVDEVALAQRAAAAKVLVSPGRRWFPAEATGSYLRMSYASAPPETFARAVGVVARLLANP